MSVSTEGRRESCEGRLDDLGGRDEGWAPSLGSSERRVRPVGCALRERRALGPPPTRLC